MRSLMPPPTRTVGIFPECPTRTVGIFSDSAKSPPNRPKCHLREVEVHDHAEFHAPVRAHRHRLVCSCQNQTAPTNSAHAPLVSSFTLYHPPLRVPPRSLPPALWVCSERPSFLPPVQTLLNVEVLGEVEVHDHAEFDAPVRAHLVYASGFGVYGL